MDGTQDPARLGPELPPSRLVELRGREPVWIYDAAGPPGAPTVLLLHGLGASAALNWFTAFDALSDHFRVIAPDHRGHGRTPAGREPFTLNGCADDAFAVADALGIDHLIAVGYSMGGPVAQLMWRRQPSRVDGLVLAATSRDFGGRVSDRIAFQLLPFLLAATRVPGYRRLRLSALSLLGPRFDGPPDRSWVLDELGRADPRSMIQAAAELGRFSSRDWIGTIDVPTSVVVTTRDQLVPPRRQLKLAGAINDSVAAFVDGDHYSAGRAAATFVPTLVNECRSVAHRATRPGRPTLRYSGHISR